MGGFWPCLRGYGHAWVGGRLPAWAAQPAEASLADGTVVAGAGLVGRAGCRSLGSWKGAGLQDFEDPGKKQDHRGRELWQVAGLHDTSGCVGSGEAGLWDTGVRVLHAPGTARFGVGEGVPRGPCVQGPWMWGAGGGQLWVLAEGPEGMRCCGVQGCGMPRGAIGPGVGGAGTGLPPGCSLAAAQPLP